MASTMLKSSSINSSSSVLNTLKDDKVIPFLKDVVAGTLKEEEEIDQNKLKFQAKKFLSAIDKINMQSTQKLRNALKNPSVVSSSYIDSLKEDVIRDQAKYFLAMNFEEQVDKFRGDQLKRKMIYVETSSDNVTIKGSYEFTIQELIYNSADGKFKDFSNMVKNLKDKKSNSIESTKEGKEQEEHVREAQMVYSATIRRLQRYNEVARPTGAKFYTKNKDGEIKESKNPFTKAAHGYILQKEGSSQMPANMVSYGDAKEAYISFLFDKHNNDLCQAIPKNYSNEYGTHDSIRLFHKYYISKVDNRKALVNEDVMTNNFQYGVKGSGAGLPDIQPYYTLAIYIVNSKEPISKEDFKNYLETDSYQKQAVERNAVRDMEEALNKVVKESLDDAMMNFTE